MSGLELGSVALMPKRDQKRTAPKELRGVLARNVRALMDQTPDISSATELGKLAGVGPATVKNLLNEKHAATVDTIEAISKPLGVSPWRLLKPEEPGAVRHHPAESAAYQLDERLGDAMHIKSARPQLREKRKLKTHRS